MHHSDEERFLELFPCGRWYVTRTNVRPAAEGEAIAKRKAEYKTVHNKPGEFDVKMHLDGKVCLVFKPDIVRDHGGRSETLCSWGAFDFDTYVPQTVEIIKDDIRTRFPFLLTDRTKSGGLHGFVFLDMLRPKQQVQALLRMFARELGAPDCEIFPSDIVAEGKEPYGIAMPFFGDREGFEQFRPEIYSGPFPAAAPPRQAEMPDDSERTRYSLQLRVSPVEFEKRLGAKLHFRRHVDADGGTSYYCHGLTGKPGTPWAGKQQPCFIEGIVHPGREDNTRQFRFLVTRDARIVANCFDDHTIGQGKYTITALKRLGLQDLLETPAKDLERAWRELFDTREQFDAAPPLTFAIKDFLQSEAITAIAGLSGHGKTWVALSLVRALLYGPGMLWDFFEVPKRFDRVIYLIPECTRGPIKTRLQLMNLYDEIEKRLFIRTLNMGKAPELDDPRLLFAVKHAAVVLDTGVRFMKIKDEGNASEIAEGLSQDMMGLLRAEADNVTPLFHSPKSFRKESVMTLENMIRGSSEIGAVLATAWGIKQIDELSNIIHVQNLKPRDFLPCGPFQLMGRPHIDKTGDFRMLKRPEDCGSLADEQPELNRGGGASQAQREAKAANLALMKTWIEADPDHAAAPELRQKFAGIGIELTDSTIRSYKAILKGKKGTP
jgi:hypothetical protein